MSSANALPASTESRPWCTIAPHGTAQQTAACVRRFAESDIPGVAMLHRRVFAGGSDSRELAEYRKYLSDVFLDQAGPTPLSSLVYERGGSILGFLGVVPRLM